MPLIWINAFRKAVRACAPMWQPISTAPFDCDLELAVINGQGTHSLVFACRRTASGWINAQTKARVDVRPTHWRLWTENPSSSAA